MPSEESEQQPSSIMNLNNPFHSDKSNREFTVGDLFIGVLLPMVPLYGATAGLASVYYYLRNRDTDQFGSAEEAKASAIWAGVWQVIWILAVIIYVV